MKNLSPIYDLIRADGSIVINKNLIFSLGINEAIIYTELIAKFNYFNTRERLTEDGYFFNTVDNLLLDTGIGEKAQRTSIKNLKGLGLIDYRVKGIPPKRYFKVVDNSHLLLSYIETGRNNREILEKKLVESADTSKLRIIGGIKNAESKESITEIVRVNNTKVNNTKERYAILPNDDSFLNLYCFYFKIIKGKDHMKVKESKLEEVMEWVNDLRYKDIDEEYFKEGVIDHFNDLPEGNSGNIITFMESSQRHYEVRSPKQLRESVY